MKAILGTMTFSDQVDISGSLDMISLFCDQGYSELDSAYMYNDGLTEALLGELLISGTIQDVSIATKVNPWDGDGLKPDEIAKQFETSLSRLKVDSVDLLYLHGPDLKTDIRQTLETCQGYYKKGCFRRLGLSNYASWQVAEVVEICRASGWVVPTVYQGLYNALNRTVEPELFPCLRNYGISFYAYNPLAGGMLTGKHQSFSEAPMEGRFNQNESYQSRYWTKNYFAAMSGFVAACEKNKIGPADAAMRWLVNHSGLDIAQGDGVILGASKIEHLEANLKGMKGGYLPDDVVATLDDGWQRVKAEAFRYFRP